MNIQTVIGSVINKQHITTHSCTIMLVRVFLQKTDAYEVEGHNSDEINS